MWFLIAMSAPLSLILAPRTSAPTMVIEGSGVERLRVLTKDLPKHKIPLPAELKLLGCDDELWGKIRAKEAFVRLIDAGDEAGLKARLDQVRNAPSITGEEWAMPAVLAEWGCTEDLWAQIRSKRNLLEVARNGDEELGRQRITKLREVIEREALEADAAAAEKPRRAKTAKPRAAKSKRPALADGYTLAGEPPAGTDVAAVEALLAERVAAKISKDYETADGLQAQLEGMGVFCNDRLMTWSGERPSKKA